MELVHLQADIVKRIHEEMEENTVKRGELKEKRKQANSAKNMVAKEYTAKLQVCPSAVCTLFVTLFGVETSHLFQTHPRVSKDQAK
jgi:urease alpha subunit